MFDAKYSSCKGRFKECLDRMFSDKNQEIISCSFSEMNLVEKKGDLFSSPKEYSMAHCVSADLRMGAGIALEFRRRYQSLVDLHKQNPMVGKTLVLRPYDRDGYLFYLVTKDRYWQKPTYETLRKSLIDLREKVENLWVHSLAIPKIGCGLDNLEWSEVRKIISDVFKEVPILIEVYIQ